MNNHNLFYENQMGFRCLFLDINSKGMQIQHSKIFNNLQAVIKYFSEVKVEVNKKSIFTCAGC